MPSQLTLTGVGSTGGGTPPIITFRLLTESGDPIITESGDYIVTEDAP